MAEASRPYKDEHSETSSDTAKIRRKIGTAKLFEEKVCEIAKIRYLWLSPKVLPLGRKRKKTFFLCYSLAYSYLCTYN